MCNVSSVMRWNTVHINMEYSSSISHRLLQPVRTCVIHEMCVLVCYVLTFGDHFFSGVNVHGKL